MVLEITLPFGSKDNIKDIVFTILTKEYPLRLIDLMNFIRKRHGKSVTFQAVRKAVLQLKEENVLKKEENKFSINIEWIAESKRLLGDIYESITKEKTSSDKTDSIGGNVTVFTFNSLNKMMKFWQQLIDQWYKKFDKDYPFNCYQAAHLWEGLLHSDEERIIMDQLKHKGIKAHILTTGNTPLDKQIVKFYSKIGIKTHIEPSSSSFDKSYYVGTYGDLVVQSQYPEEIVKALDVFFKKNKKLEDLDLVELSEIVNRKQEVKLTVIKDLNMAKQINKSIISQFP